VFGVSRLFEPATEWIQKMPQIISQVERRLQNLRHSVAQVSKAAEQVERLASVNAKPKADKAEVVAPNATLFSRVLGATQNFLMSAASTVILLYFLLASGDMFLRKMVRVLDTFEDKRTAVGVARAIQSDMARYLFTITCINMGLGTLVGIALHLLGMPNPVLWGVMVAVANYVPYIGSGTNLVILTIIAFLTFDHIERVLLVSGVYLGLQILEAQIVTPILTGRSLTLNPVVIFVAMLFWTWMWGVVGALIAVPLLMMLKIFCDHIESLEPVGEFLSGRREEVIGPEPATGL
jgi:predicted PurR-regulated permease PerM